MFRAVRILAALVIALAIGLLVPLHVALEHHGEESATHEAGEHGPADHDVSGVVKARAATVALRPLFVAILASIDALTLSPARAATTASGPDARHDPPPLESATRSPAPPRAPPALRA